MLGLPHWGKMSLSCHPALLFVGGRGATAGKSGTFPQGTGEQIPRVWGTPFLQRWRERAEGCSVPKESAQGLGDRRREGRGSDNIRQWESCVCVWRISVRGLSAS